MGVSFLPKTLVFIFLEKNGTCPGEGGSLADRWRIVGAGPADDIAFSRTPQEALCDLFPNLVDRAPRGYEVRKGPGRQAQKGPRSQENSGMASRFSGLPQTALRPWGLLSGPS